MNLKEFMKMAEVYLKAPCPDCGSSGLVKEGVTFVNGENGGQIHMHCNVCDTALDLNVFKIKDEQILH